MRTKATVLFLLVLTVILAIGNFKIAMVNLVVFGAVQAVGFLLSLLSKNTASRAGIRSVVSVVILCTVFILSMKKNSLDSLFFVLVLPACGVSTVIDLLIMVYEKIRAAE